MDTTHADVTGDWAQFDRGLGQLQLWLRGVVVLVALEALLVPFVASWASWGWYATTLVSLGVAGLRIRALATWRGWAGGTRAAHVARAAWIGAIADLVATLGAAVAYVLIRYDLASVPRAGLTVATILGIVGNLLAHGGFLLTARHGAAELGATRARHLVAELLVVGAALTAVAFVHAVRLLQDPTNTAGAWGLFILLLASMGAVLYFALIQALCDGRRGRPPDTNDAPASHDATDLPDSPARGFANGAAPGRADA